MLLEAPGIFLIVSGMFARGFSKDDLFEIKLRRLFSFLGAKTSGFLF